MMRDKNWKWKLVWIAPIGLAAIALVTYLGGKVVEWLWNWLMPVLFGLHTVTFWQALALLVLCRILFGGHGFGRGGGRGPKHPSNLRKQIFERISDRVVERWDEMTPEERERLWQRLNEKRNNP